MIDTNSEVVGVESAGAETKRRQAELDAAAKLREADIDAETKLRQAKISAGAKLLQAEVDAVATLRQAEVPAAAKLLQAEVDAEAALRQAEVPASAKLLQAEVDAEATLRRAEKVSAAPHSAGEVETADAKLLQAEVDAAATLRRAEVPAAAKLVQAERDAAATLRRAEVPAAAKLLRAEADAAVTLRVAEQEISYRYEDFDRFFALSTDTMCISSLNGYFTRVSPSFDLLGYDRGELLTRLVLDLVHPDDKAATQAAYATLAPGRRTIHFENRYCCKDGTYRWLSWVSGMSVPGVVYSMARDVTEIKRCHDAMTRANRELQNANRELENANRELESFSYAVAHDLQAPLRSIDGFSQALLEDYVGKLDKTGQRYLTFIHQSARQMKQLIDDLLGLSRLTRGEVRCENVDLSLLASVTSQRLQASQPERDVDVVIQDGLHGDGDPRLLAVMLENLIGNAWKFTAKRAKARIEFGARVVAGDEPRAYFVRDNGVGFEMALASSLFVVFRRLHSADEFEGTGVGLATVERIVERHGGRVWAEGEVGRGATFYFTLHDPRR